MSEPHFLRTARAKGLIISEGPAAKSEPVKLIVPTFRPSLERPVWEIPLETRAEANKRDWWKRSKRSDGAWRAVSRAMGPHLAYLVRFASDFHSGIAVYARFTRLGGGRLDQMVNLPSALKAVEDAVAWLMGVDDGSPLWHPRCEQEAGEYWGVRVELSSEEFRS